MPKLSGHGVPGFHKESAYESHTRVSTVSVISAHQARSLLLRRYELIIRKTEDLYKTRPGCGDGRTGTK